MLIRSDVEIANLTDVGCERGHNEDYYSYAEPDSDEEFEKKGRLLVLADGMGGHKGGQVASGIAVEAVRQVFLSDDAPDLHALQELLIAGFSRAQQEILARSMSDPELHGMGTTCTAAIVHKCRLLYGHIGDSRLYLVRDGTAAQLTEDHSFVNQLVKNGALTPQQAAAHEKRNVLTSALGMRSGQVAADFSEQPVPLRVNDALLLSSDGLHGLVSAEEIGQAVASETAYDACRTLVNLAKQRGGPDNITVQILRILAEAP